jgi:hypothetical protein
MHKKILIAMDRNEPIEIEASGVIRAYLWAAAVIGLVVVSTYAVWLHPWEMIAVYGSTALCLAVLATRDEKS